MPDSLLPQQANPSGGFLPVQVAAGLVFRSHFLLITRRRHTDHLGGLWEFPGGKRRPEEAYEDCLKRELREELAIEVHVRELYREIAHIYPDKAVLLRFYLCDWMAHEPQCLGCDDFAWISRQQLNEYEFPEADAQLLHALQSDPQLWE